VYGAAIYTERGSRASRWASRTCYNYGFEYETQINPNIDGFVNLRALLKAFSLYKDSSDVRRLPVRRTGMGENIDAYRSGQVAMCR
jgi:hypothetical protein